MLAMNLCIAINILKSSLINLKFIKFYCIKQAGSSNKNEHIFYIYTTNFQETAGTLHNVKNTYTLSANDRSYSQKPSSPISDLTLHLMADHRKAILSIHRHIHSLYNNSICSASSTHSPNPLPKTPIKWSLTPPIPISAETLIPNPSILVLILLTQLILLLPYLQPLIQVQTQKTQFLLLSLLNLLMTSLLLRPWMMINYLTYLGATNYLTTILLVFIKVKILSWFIQVTNQPI